MQVKKIMTKNPACCTADSTLQEVAHMMEMYDCGCIPVVEDHQTKRAIGTVTDRDITIRTFSAGKNPLEMKASDVMTTDIVTVTPDTDIYQCLNTMEEKQIRRVLVADKSGRCVGIVAQADIAEHGTNPRETMNFLREVSESESDRSHQRSYQSDRSRQNDYESDRSYRGGYESNRSFQGDYESNRPQFNQTRDRKNYRSFSQNQNFDRPRQSFRKQYVEKESFFNSSNLLTLLGTIGLGAGLSYYFGIGTEAPTVKKIRTQHLDTKNIADKKTVNVPVSTTPPLGHTSSTLGTTPSPMPTSSTIDKAEIRDTITGSGSAGSFNMTNNDDDLKPITEVGRTANNT